MIDATANTRGLNGFRHTVARHAATGPGDGYAFAANATIVEPITLYGAGPIGSPSYTRELAAGTRVEILEHADGLARIRYRPDDDVGALVDEERLASDVDARHVAEAYATVPADEPVTLHETDDDRT